MSESHIPHLGSFSLKKSENEMTMIVPHLTGLYPTTLFELQKKDWTPFHSAGPPDSHCRALSYSPFQWKNIGCFPSRILWKWIVESSSSPRNVNVRVRVPNKTVLKPYHRMCWQGEMPLRFSVRSLLRSNGSHNTKKYTPSEGLEMWLEIFGGTFVISTCT